MAMIHVVGLGPAGPEHLTSRALELIDSAELVFLRTSRHPSAAFVLDRRPDASSFDDNYEAGKDWESVYGSIVTALLEATAGGAIVCYCVPGSPAVAERTVELLRQLAPPSSVALRVEPAVSYLDLAWDRLEIDPLAAGVRLADASSFEAAAAGLGGPVLVSQAWSAQLLSDIKLALDEPAPQQEAVILHHLGLPDERVETVRWADLDRVLEPDHLTSVFVPSLETPPGADFVVLAETVATLRRECPWDREQTHRSLLRGLLEETYEAMEALEALGDDPATAPAEAVAHVEEELGDLLCQVVFHATLAREEGLFTLVDVARSLNAKLVSRHPHVFGDVRADTSDDVTRNWERSKDISKGRSHLLEGIPAALPALARTEKVERKLRSVGLGWERSGESPAELAERLSALLSSEAGAGSAPPGDDELAFGELVMLLARMAADRRIDPEAALRRALERLSGRLSQLETEANAAGRDLAGWVAEGVPEHHLPLC